MSEAIEANELSSLGELNKRAAEQIVGWHNVWVNERTGSMYGDHRLFHGIGYAHGPIPAYAVDVRDAFRLVSEMLEMGWKISIAYLGEGTGWECEFSASDLRPVVVAGTLPEAICRAALAAIEGERERAGKQ